jgi:hypothetical protein
MGIFYRALLTIVFISFMVSQARANDAELVNIANKPLVPLAPIHQAKVCILKIIAEKMNATLPAIEQWPTLRLEGEVSLKYYQDQVEPWWNFRPDMFTNVFVPNSNEVFLFTEKAYYKRHKRSIFDSLAHELVHYIQVMVNKIDLKADPMNAEMAESEAVSIQTWFRETYEPQKSDHFSCPY